MLVYPAEGLPPLLAADGAVGAREGERVGEGAERCFEADAVLARSPVNLYSLN